jgi:hypothetical protein
LRRLLLLLLLLLASLLPLGIAGEPAQHSLLLLLLWRLLQVMPCPGRQCMRCSCCCPLPHARHNAAWPTCRMLLLLLALLLELLPQPILLLPVFLLPLLPLLLPLTIAGSPPHHARLLLLRLACSVLQALQVLHLLLRLPICDSGTKI